MRVIGNLRRVLMVVLLTVASLAAPIEPESYGVVFHLWEGRLQPLETQRAEFESLHVQPPISRDCLVLNGTRSQIRFGDNQPLQFAVRYRMPLANQPPWATPTLDPTAFQLYSLRCDGQRRLLVLSESTPLRTTVHGGLSLQVSPLGSDSLKLQTGQALAPGEYAVLYGRSPSSCNLYCFGVDPSSPASSP